MDRKGRLAEFIRRVWSEGEVEGIEGWIAGSYAVRHDPGDPWEGRTLTPTEFGERVVVSRAAAPDQRFEIVGMVEEGDRIAVAWTWTGTHLGDLPGFPATGRALAMSGLTIYDFEGDRIAGHWQVADRLAVYRAISAP